MGATWNTKWGVRRVRVELPTLAEALDAAAGLSANEGEQIQIAASLMEQPVADIKADAERILRARMRRPQTLQHRVGRQPLVVERKVSRRVFVR